MLKNYVKREVLEFIIQKNMRMIFEKVEYIYNQNTPFEKHVLKDINFRINDGETVFILGNTGSGKTTLLYLLDFLIKPTSGKIWVDDFRDPYENPYEYRKKIGFSFQFPERQFFSEKVRDEIYFSIKNFEVENPKMRFREVVNFFDLNEYLDRSPFQLSGGEQRRIAIASAVAHNPDILILDEPTVGLDRKNEKKIIQYLKKWNDDARKTLVIVTHDFEKFVDFKGIVYELDDGILRKRGVKH
ncbi:MULTISPECIES: ATP-binding cassette domain-containing protein [unclassified Thermosipho (in: thermotogales)]|uniref:ATP-binding cassette domain-containing protein n=1 Tax=unclassified Thermosipho (in: thermotogales) TaxID=2676525 RepID=UPI001E342B89|nr:MULTISPECIES: ATP-binding cassette domain-containing protein [unclassified Thermosipho (in: thermotogales)]